MENYVALLVNLSVWVVFTVIYLIILRHYRLRDKIFLFLKKSTDKSLDYFRNKVFFKNKSVFGLNFIHMLNVPIFQIETWRRVNLTKIMIFNLLLGIFISLLKYNLIFNESKYQSSIVSYCMELFNKYHWVALFISFLYISQFVSMYRKRKLRREFPDNALYICLSVGLLLWNLGVIWLFNDTGSDKNAPLLHVTEFFCGLLSYFIIIGLLNLYRMTVDNVLEDLNRVFPLLVLLLVSNFTILSYYNELKSFRDFEKFLRFLLDISYTVSDSFALAISVSLYLSPNWRQLRPFQKKYIVGIALGMTFYYTANLIYGLSHYVYKEDKVSFYGSPNDMLYLVAMSCFCYSLYWLHITLGERIKLFRDKASLQTKRNNRIKTELRHL